MYAYKIEKGIAIPNRSSLGSYPFAGMAVGDSFAVPIAKKSKAVSAAHHWGKDHEKKFTSRSTKSQVRIWRVK